VTLQSIRVLEISELSSHY